jgi:hypothetical protein
MSVNFIESDRKTPFLLPPSIEEWLPEGHLDRFVVEIIEQLDLSSLTESLGAALYLAAGENSHGVLIRWLFVTLR